MKSALHVLIARQATDWPDRRHRRILVADIFRADIPHVVDRDSLRMSNQHQLISTVAKAMPHLYSLQHLVRWDPASIGDHVPADVLAHRRRAVELQQQIRLEAVLGPVELVGRQTRAYPLPLIDDGVGRLLEAPALAGQVDAPGRRLDDDTGTNGCL